MIGNGKRRKHDEQVSDPSKDALIEPDEDLIRKHNPKKYHGLQEVDGVIIHFIGGSSCKIDRMSVDQMTQFIEDRTKVARKCGDPDPNLIRIEGGPFFQLKNVTYVEPWEHTEMVIDMEDKNEK